MQALAEAHALSESRVVYEQDREQEAQELSHQFCVSPSTARATLVEHGDFDKARHDLQRQRFQDAGALHTRKASSIELSGCSTQATSTMHSYNKATVIRANRLDSPNVLRHSEPGPQAQRAHLWLRLCGSTKTSKSLKLSRSVAA
jgi:hypothetical protein